MWFVDLIPLSLSRGIAIQTHDMKQEELHPGNHVKQHKDKKLRIPRKLQGIPGAEEWTHLHNELINSFKKRDCSSVLEIFASVKLNGFHLVRSFMSRNMYDGILHLCASYNRMAEGMEVLRVMQGILLFSASYVKYLCVFIHTACSPSNDL